MKKVIYILAAFIITISVSACSHEPEQKKTEQTTEQTVTQETHTEVDITEVKKYLSENFEKARLDGSTSMLPLHQSLKNLFGSGEEAWHNMTVEAFKKFIDNENDILIGVDYSDELLESAENSGVNLIKKEITREAFVFLINKNNPIKNLTTKQIKDIYSGKITNWAEVGGDDAPIKAYQRNSDSGSQIRMVKFMEGSDLIDKDVEYIHGMGDVIEKIASYDEGKYSVAYNMYTFTERQYLDSEVTMLSVDGISPNDETIFYETYPITIYNYLYYDENNAFAVEFADNLYAYLMSDDGQKLISDSGYVNLNTNYDRNKNIEKPFDYYDSGEMSINFYNKAKGEFYDIDQNGDLLTFTNYADYVLRGSKYNDNEKAREFLDLVFNSTANVTQMTASLSEEEGYIDFAPHWDASFDPEDFFNFKFKDKYYFEFKYYIDEDKYRLESFLQQTFDSYKEYLSAFPDYSGGVDPNGSAEFSSDELNEVYVRKYEYTATLNGNAISEEDGFFWDQDGLKIQLEFYRPFE
ncbi:MAG: substrate-binding domain-containing protein [Eubacterium sp.]|jgi:phosphate transport system substrate-binding protein|nr:substrate-binding domain-containing protein [Eubacterium sp.]